MTVAPGGRSRKTRVFKVYCVGREAEAVTVPEMQEAMRLGRELRAAGCSHVETESLWSA